MSNDMDPETAQLVEGLRARKKRLTRQLISDTATVMFLECGFDEVKVADIAEACGVSEKTVYNYFPTKESLLLDREEEMALALRNALGPGAPARSPIDAARDILAKDLDMMRFWWTQREAEEADGLLLFHRFTELVASTPSLRAAQRDMTERLVDVAAEAMAARAGVSPDDPEPRIAAHALLGLWEIQWQSLLRNTDGQHTPEQALALVAADVERAAKLIDSGLWAFGVMVQGKGNREQVKAAADAAQSAGRQVATALRQARTLWQQIQDEHTAASTGDRQRDRERHRAQSDASRRAQREQREQWKQVIREQQQHWREARRTMHEQQREQLRQQADEWQTAAEEWKKWGQL